MKSIDALRINTSGLSRIYYIYIYILNLMITVSEDALALNGDGPSAGRVLTENLYMFSVKFDKLTLVIMNWF